MAETALTAPERFPTFPTPFIDGDYGDGNQPMTVLELNILRLKQSILEKPEWHTKVNNEEIVARWREESAEHVNEAAFRLAIGELRATAARIVEGKSDGILESGIEGVFFSQSLVEEELRKRLLECNVALEERGRRLGSWHPGSGEKVLDTVHPSMFCFVEGFTKTRVHNGPPKRSAAKPQRRWARRAAEEAKKEDEPMPIPEDEDLGLPQTWDSILAKVTDKLIVGKAGEGDDDDSGKKTIEEVIEAGVAARNGGYDSALFQWLPAEFNVAADTGHVTIDSYINNLHPVEHADLYECLASIFQRFVPAFNKVLSRVVLPRTHRIKADPYDWYEEFTGDTNDDDAYDNYHESREPKPLEVPEFDAQVFADGLQGVEEGELKVNLKGSRLQVIVKMAQIELTPEKRNYDGGSWHVEGTTRESIIATGIYYYESTNIVGSRLAFRQAVCEPDYEQSDDKGVRIVYGLENEGALNQNLGSVPTTENLCLVFPNTMQHRVKPFELADPTRPGTRKILVFFLVDPNKRVDSTAHILPQQREWYEKFAPKSEAISRHLADNATWPMTREQALYAQESLIEERAEIVTHNNEVLFEREFSLCEH